MSTHDRSHDWSGDGTAHTYGEPPWLAFPDEGQVVAGIVAYARPEGVLVDVGCGAEQPGLIPMHELPSKVAGKAREALSVGDKIEAVVLDARYGSLPVLSVTMFEERLAWSEDPTDSAMHTHGADAQAPAGTARPDREPAAVRSRVSASDDPNPTKDGERAVPTTISHQLVDPTEFLQPNRRLFIDTNVFMNTEARRAGGLKRLFERGQTTILANGNPIIVPTKVVDELKRQSRLDPSKESSRRAEAIKKAGAALAFLESASAVGLVRKDLGDGSNPYADDLFVELFERFAETYEMCLLTHDITIKLRIRLLANRLSKRLLVGSLTKDGDLEIESDSALFESGYRKHERLTAHVAAGTGGAKDESEVAVLKPLLDAFGEAFGFGTPATKTASQTTRAPKVRTATPRASASSTAAPVNPFSARARIKPSDTPLTYSALPGKGDRVSWASADKTGTLVLGQLLGEGGEGSVYEGDRNTVVKIFDKDHLTRHRKEKIELLVGRNLRTKGLCIPSAIVRNNEGDFVGYVMPKASGREFQRTVFNKRKFEREFPNWKKADLVDICISFLEKVQYLHSMNVILGDINPKNLMVDEKKNVFIIDADSWQLEGYPCPVGTPMFTSPAMLGKTYSDDLRTMDDELFAVATMLFMIVMTGQFPYIRTGTDGDMVQLIKEGNFAFQYENRNNKDQPEGDWKYMWSHIHKPVKDLFWHTFHREGKRYKKRPTADEWLEAFKNYKSYLWSSRMSFDPMSNDVYPIRNKAFKQDTPIQDCPTCGRKNAIAGIWNDDTEEYFIPRRCNKCRDQQPARSSGAYTDTTRTAPTRSTTSSTALCKDCHKSYPVSQLKFGRCPTCTTQANALDPHRLCVDCQQPFITFDHTAWFTAKALDVPKSHSAIKQSCPPVGSTTNAANKRATASAKTGFWTRLGNWLSGN